MCYAYIYIFIYSRVSCMFGYFLRLCLSRLYHKPFSSRSICGNFPFVRCVLFYNSTSCAVSVWCVFSSSHFCIRKHIHRAQKLIILEQWIRISFVRLRLCMCAITIATAAAATAATAKIDVCACARCALWGGITFYIDILWPGIHILRITIIISVTQLLLLRLHVAVVAACVCSIPIAYLPFEFGLINMI